MPLGCGAVRFGAHHRSGYACVAILKPAGRISALLYMVPRRLEMAFKACYSSRDRTRRTRLPEVDACVIAQGSAGKDPGTGLPGFGRAF